VGEVVIAIVLGVIQGVAEFLPISSSGHLRVVQDLFGWTDEFGLAFDTLVHVATLLAVVVYFRKDLWHMLTSAFSRAPERAHDRRLAWLIVIATIPTGIIGLVGGDWFEAAPTLYVGVAFLCTSLFLTAADRLSAKSIHDPARLQWWRAVFIGVAQGVAIMPGISRAGATMAAGLGMGLDREQAARFSFLLSTPIILLAGAKQAMEVVSEGTALPGVAALVAGFLVAALTGYLAIAVLMSFIKKHSFAVFAIYTAVLGISVIVWQLAA
jgi:undecaprenyl-diphosphatase